MQQTRFNRVVATLIGNDAADPNLQPAILCTALKSPLRVVCRNTGFAQEAYLAVDDVQSLLEFGSGAPGSNIFELPAGASETFVLAPGQKLYAGSTGGGAIISVAISDALPPDFGDERRFAP